MEAPRGLQGGSGGGICYPFITSPHRRWGGVLGLVVGTLLVEREKRGGGMARERAPTGRAPLAGSAGFSIYICLYIMKPKKNCKKKIFFLFFRPVIKKSNQKFLVFTGRHKGRKSFFFRKFLLLNFGFLLIRYN
nr:hypothetical protein [Morchella crassipes]